jgi:predicted alpha/beta-hydrolase family hydrolase
LTAPLFLFAPGAGAPSSSAWMTAWAKRLATIGTVVRFDYPYMLEGRRSPDRQPKLVEAHRAALEEARQGRAGKVVLAGKSMGSRIGCHVSVDASVDGLVCFGYPLKGPSKAAKRGDVRDAVLVELRTPILFIAGTRDPLCPLDLLETVRPRMTARNELHVVEGGDHSLAVSAKSLKDASERQSDVDGRILGAVARFVESL